ALNAVPQEWFARLPGECLTSLHLWVLSNPRVDVAQWVKKLLQEDTLVASHVAGEISSIYTDFALHGDSFSRMVLVAGELPPRRLGRLVQRLLEIETYRMAALLGLPIAREANQMLSSAELELADLARAIRSATRDDEPLLLDRLTKLASQVESQHAATHSRFSASAAYFELVDKRISDINETAFPGMQTIGEFMERRLTPARSTCEWATLRQDALSQRVSRISNLLRTRVEIEQQQSTQALLATMNQRQDMQLKLQSTVEGLSVAAITYYIVGLVSYLAKGGAKLGWPWSAETTAAVAIPLVAIAVWWSLKRLHNKVFKPRKVDQF
ncbi:MAG: putative membrane-anchored protein, partial [Rhodoferax sp.]